MEIFFYVTDEESRIRNRIRIRSKMSWIQNNACQCVILWQLFTGKTPTLYTVFSLAKGTDL
jgi:hypothetical protein